MVDFDTSFVVPVRALDLPSILVVMPSSGTFVVYHMAIYSYHLKDTLAVHIAIEHTVAKMVATNHITAFLNSTNS